MLDIVTDRTYRSDQDCDVDCRLLEESGLLDVQAYCASAGLEDGAHAARHYLLHGWRAGLEPSRNFEGGFLYPYYRRAGLDGPPALTFLMLRAAGWSVYTSREQAQETANVVGSSTLFDAVGYAARAGGLEGLDPALHYVLVGEELGLPPSAAFDPEYYRHRNPDLPAAAINRFHHYLAHGRAEGRRGISVSETLAFDRQRLDASRETILLFAHDASRTGAPIIAYHIALRLQQKYNVVAVLLGAGELFPVFESCCAAVVGPIPHTEWCEVEAKHLVTRLCASYRVLYAREQHRNADGAACAGTRSHPGGLAGARVRVATRPAGHGPGARLVDPGCVPAAIAYAAQREHPTLEASRFTCPHRRPPLC
jgi:hypothetical protein